MNTKKTIVIIDYGLGNLYSLAKALKRFSDEVLISSVPKIIMSADAAILPGVGAFAAGMDGLKERSLIPAIQKFAESGKPMLGICLGAQMMLDTGLEFGEHKGLGLIKGKVKIFPESVAALEKIPQIGWNKIISLNKIAWEKTIFDGVPSGSLVYFVHSYIMIPENPENIFSTAEYGGCEFCAAIKKGNIYGMQFHPEKSGEVGLSIIRNFCKLADTYDKKK